MTKFSSAKKQLFLKYILSIDQRRQFNVVIANCTRDEIKVLCELVLNFLQGVIPTTAKQRDRLRRYKTYYETVSRSKLSAVERKKLVLQNKRAIRLLVRIAVPKLT